MNVKKIAEAALAIEADLKEMEKRLLQLKKSVIYETLSLDAMTAELNTLLEILRR